jgi:hypothetical protein
MSVLVFAVGLVVVVVLTAANVIFTLVLPRPPQASSVCLSQ